MRHSSSFAPHLIFQVAMMLRVAKHYNVWLNGLRHTGLGALLAGACIHVVCMLGASLARACIHVVCMSGASLAWRVLTHVRSSFGPKQGPTFVVFLDACHHFTVAGRVPTARLTPPRTRLC